MYAVIETGGKQYRVAPGDVIDIERMAQSGEGDSSIRFDRVLMVTGDNGARFGNPVVEGALVKASLVDSEKAGRASASSCADAGTAARHASSRTHEPLRRRAIIRC